MEDFPEGDPLQIIGAKRLVERGIYAIGDSPLYISVIFGIIVPSIMALMDFVLLFYWVIVWVKGLR